MSFLGYPRENGTVGTRNYILILPGGLVSTKICEFVNGTKTVITSDVGSGRTKRDRETIARTLVGLGRNPNVAGVIIHGINPGAGYPELATETIASRIAETGKPVEVIAGKAYPDAMKIIERGIRVARQIPLSPFVLLLRTDPMHLDKPTMRLAGDPARPMPHLDESSRR